MQIKRYLLNSLKQLEVADSTLQKFWRERYKVNCTAEGMYHIRRHAWTEGNLSRLSMIKVDGDEA